MRMKKDIGIEAIEFIFVFRSLVREVEDILLVVVDELAVGVQAAARLLAARRISYPEGRRLEGDVAKVGEVGGREECFGSRAVGE
jgi:hypothetical protein